MYKQAQDRRIIKTKKKLKDTLVKLIQEKTIDKITVKELVEQADLNRGTFYFHYKDIYNFLETIETEALNEITFILFLFFMCLQLNAQTCIQTFTASGQDSGPTVLTINSTRPELKSGIYFAVKYASME